MFPSKIRNRPQLWLSTIILLSLTGLSKSADVKLKAQFHTSVSVRTPNVKERPVVRTIADRDTTVMVKNPFDYELAVGVRGGAGGWAFVMDYQFERQNSFHFINQEYALSHDWTHFKLGGRMRDIEEDKLYYANFYFEAKVYGWVGVGVERAYYSPWLEDGATMGRFSLVKNQFKVYGAQFHVTATHSFNPSQNRTLARAEIRNFEFGRIGVVPFYQIERVDRKNQPPVRSFRGKIRLTIDL